MQTREPISDRNLSKRFLSALALLWHGERNAATECGDRNTATAYGERDSACEWGERNASTRWCEHSEREEQTNRGDRNVHSGRGSTPVEYVGLAMVVSLLMGSIGGAIDSEAGERLAEAIVEKMIAALLE